MKIITFTLAVCLLAWTAGCESPQPSPSLADQIKNLQNEKTRLVAQLEQLKTENHQLQDQISRLAAIGLPPETRAENIYRLDTIRISNYTNLFDKDKDGKKEKLLVYLQPIDQDGDIIKAAGAVDVELWDLSKEPDHALLGKWRVEPGQLRKLWFSKLLVINYRLDFDVPQTVAEIKEPLTVKVDFTDQLTGRVFKQQTVISPQ